MYVRYYKSNPLGRKKEGVENSFCFKFKPRNVIIIVFLMNGKVFLSRSMEIVQAD